MQANPKKVEVIRNYPRPATVKQIQSFLGICNYFRRYVRNFAKLAKPLTFLLKKEQPFIWTGDQQKAFESLKNSLAEMTLLSFIREGEMIYCTVDSSSFALGALLSCGELPNDRPIAFFSKTLNEAQRRYSTIERELLAIVEAVKAFRVYLYGRFFILYSDHRPLCYIFSMKDCSSRLFRQKLELMDYNFKILYKPGAQNHVADALSRIGPMTIDEMLKIHKEKEICEKQMSVVTRNQSKLASELGIQYTIEEKPGIILAKRNFDLVFHLIPLEKDNLKERIMNKFGIVSFSQEFRLIGGCHYVRLISNQSSNSQNTVLTKRCIEKILELSEEKAGYHWSN